MTGIERLKEILKQKKESRQNNSINKKDEDLLKKEDRKIVYTEKQEDRMKLFPQDEICHLSEEDKKRQTIRIQKNIEKIILERKFNQLNKQREENRVYIPKKHRRK